MSVIRIAKRTSAFTVVSSSAVNDERLSYRARGVLVWLLDKPDNWSVKSSAIAVRGTEGRDAVRSALGELEAAGYLVWEKHQNEKGFWTTESVVYELPLDIDGPQPTTRPFNESFKKNLKSFPQPEPENPQEEEMENADSQSPEPEKPTVGKPGFGKSGAITSTNEPVLRTKSSQSADKETGLRNAERLCNLLALLVEENGSKKPRVTDAWVTDMDRLIRLDGRTPEQVENAIRWSQRDTFWQANIMSPKKLRAKYDQIRLVAKRAGAVKASKVNSEEEIEKSWT